MAKTKLAKIDLNLFVVFDAIYTEGSLTRAAERLNVSQPAVSHALARLREQFNDPLFERNGKGVVPTVQAKFIIERVRQSLAILDSTVNQTIDFRASESTRVLTLGAREMFEAMALPSLMARVHEQAPNIQIRSIKVARREIEKKLIAGQLDLVADVLVPVSEQIVRHPLVDEQLVVVMREQHPVLQKNWGLAAYLEAKHVQVSSRSEGLSVEDVALSKQAQTRTIGLRCQNYQAAVQVVKHSDLMATLPASILQPMMGLVAKPLPFEVPKLELYLYWQRKAEADPAVMWLKEQLLQGAV